MIKFKILLCFILGACAPLLVVSAETQSVQEGGKEEYDRNNKELEQLRDLKNRYKASAARHEDEADRWQFQNNLTLEARRARQQAEFDRQMEGQIQQRIDYLNARQAEILKKYPELQKSSG